jgi:hypothetical protein
VSAEQDGLRLLQVALGATTLFGPPSPTLPADLDDADLFAVGCCGGWVGPAGAEVCSDCPVGLRARFYPPSPHLTAELVDEQRPAFLAPAAVGDPLVEAGKEAIAGAVCVRASGPLTDADYRAVGEFAQQLQIKDGGPDPLEDRGRAIVAAVAGGPAAFLAPAPGGAKSWQGDALWQELTNAVRLFSLEDPRSKQVEIGPSEIGHPCDARVLRTLLGVERVNLDADPWASFVGTAVHARLAAAFDWMNRQLGREQYLIERRVYVSDGVFGSCDLFRDGIVIDHKIVGTTTMRDLDRHELGAKGGIYRVQGHSYGLGWQRAGEQVTEVVIAAWPRSGFLSGLRLFREPFDASIAEAALDRMARLSASALEPDVDCDTDRFWETVPVTPSKQCGFCYWYDPTHDPDVPDRLHCGAGRAVRQSAP